jgi:pseudaminic acid synthase
MNTKPYIIAELSGNHNGDINLAFRLIEEAKKAGADAVKLQTYTADTITINCDSEDFMIKGGLWDGYKLYDLYQKAHTPWDWHEALFNKGKELGITIFSTPFDKTAVDFLEKLNAPLYKIASFELVHHPLIEYVAKLKKPMIMSTGMASLTEIQEAVEVALTNGCNDLTLLHCVSEYPAPIEHVNLATMVDLKKQFPKCKIGLSDHTLGTTVAIAAVALGASVIEKHVTLDRSAGGVDSAFSLEPEELAYLCEMACQAYLAIGRVNYERSDSERKNMVFRRSIYAVKDINEGEEFTKENIKIIRPGYGLEPKKYNGLLGKRAGKNYRKGYGVDVAEI